MGVLKRLGIGLKAGVGKPLSRADIYAYCEGFIKAPPLPPEWKTPEWKDLLNTTHFRVKGVPLTVIDYYRDQLLKPSLDKIAAGPTLAMQRAECISEAIDYDTWRNFHVCLHAAKTALGRAMIDDRLKKVFPQLNEKERTAKAMVWYVMAMLVQACLLTLGKTYFGIDKNTGQQIDICREYQREHMMVHVNIMDYVWENYSDEPKRVEELAGWKDDHVNPITDQMINLLEATKNKVIHGTFDLAEFQSAAKKLEEQRLKAVQFIHRKKNEEQVPAEKHAEAYELGRRMADSTNADVEAYMQEHFYSDIQGLVDRVYGDFKSPDLPPLVLARIDLKNFVERGADKLRPHVLAQLRSAMAGWHDVAKQAGMEAQFERLIEHHYEQFKSRSVLAAFNRLLDMTDTLKKADDQWRADNPEKAAQIPFDALGSELGDLLAPYIKK
jgi:hypothetical protein